MKDYDTFLIENYRSFGDLNSCLVQFISVHKQHCMHVFPLQYSQLPGVNCVCRYHGGSPASSDSHQLNIICTIAPILELLLVWIALESEVGLASKMYRSMLT